VVIARRSGRIQRLGAGDTTEESVTRKSEVAEPSFGKARRHILRIVYGTDMGGIPWTEPRRAGFRRMVTLGRPPWMRFNLPKGTLTIADHVRVRSA